jgi:20S proteasome alpha/beta subunit
LIYSIDLGGTMMKQEGWACNGSGSGYILGMIDDVFLKAVNVDLMLWDEEEAVHFVKKSHWISNGT